MIEDLIQLIVDYHYSKIENTIIWFDFCNHHIRFIEKDRFISLHIESRIVTLAMQKGDMYNYRIYAS